MNSEVYLVVEGLTEQLFVEHVLAPYCAMQGIYLHPTQVPKRGGKGGDVRFERVKTCVSNFLKQRSDTRVGTFVDYYGLADWPKLEEVRSAQGLSPAEIAKRLNDAAKEELCSALPAINVADRFVPFMAVHEFEALLFSDAGVLASSLGVDIAAVNDVLQEYGSPEKINTRPDKIPSRHLEVWTNERYMKTVQGIAIAGKIGIDKMRAANPNFDDWLTRLGCNRES